MEPSAPPIPNIYPVIPPHPTQEKSPEMIPRYQVPPHSAPPHLAYPPQQQFAYQQAPQQGYYPTMQPPVAAPRQSVDMGNPQNFGNPHQTIIKTEVNLGPEMMQNLQNMGISQNQELEKPQRPAPPVSLLFVCLVILYI